MTSMQQALASGPAALERPPRPPRRHPRLHGSDLWWNYTMAIAIVYSLPPIAIFYALRRYMAIGLTGGGIKG